MRYCRFCPFLSEVWFRNKLLNDLVGNTLYAKGWLNIQQKLLLKKLHYFFHKWIKCQGVCSKQCYEFLKNVAIFCTNVASSNLTQSFYIP